MVIYWTLKLQLMCSSTPLAGGDGASGAGVVDTDAGCAKEEPYIFCYYLISEIVPSVLLLYILRELPKCVPRPPRSADRPARPRARSLMTPSVTAINRGRRGTANSTPAASPYGTPVRSSRSGTPAVVSERSPLVSSSGIPR